MPNPTTTNAAQAVLFDVDGVLVDSYEPHFASWKRLAAELGKEYSREEIIAGFGRTTRDILQSQWSDLNLSDARCSELDDAKEAYYREEIAGKFPAMPGARELIDQLVDAGWNIALGSSGPRENVDLAIEQLGIANLICGSVSGSDVEFGKPHPEIYQRAAALAGVPAERCVVIEDAAPGIKSAHAAGMKCVGFVSTGHTESELSTAQMQIDSLSELTPDRLLELLNS